MPSRLITATLAMLGLLVLLTGCSSMTVNSKFDPEVDFSKYETYGWIEKTGKLDPTKFGGNPLNYRTAQKAVDKDLQKRKYQLADQADQAEFLVALHGGSQTTINVNSWGYFYGYWSYWGASSMDASSYDTGTLIIDMVDNESDQLIWRGWAQAVVDRVGDPSNKIKSAVQEILKKFPPK